MPTRLSDEDYEAIQTKNPGARLRRVVTPAGELVLRVPTSAEESAFQMCIFGDMPGMHRGIAWRNLLVATTVYPDNALLQQWLKNWPALNMNPDVIYALKAIRGEVLEEEGK